MKQRKQPPALSTNDHVSIKIDEVDKTFSVHVHPNVLIGKIITAQNMVMLNNNTVPARGIAACPSM